MQGFASTSSEGAREQKQCCPQLQNGESFFTKDTNPNLILDTAISVAYVYIHQTQKLLSDTS